MDEACTVEQVEGNAVPLAVVGKARDEAHRADQEAEVPTLHAVQSQAPRVEQKPAEGEKALEEEPAVRVAEVAKVQEPEKEADESRSEEVEFQEGLARRSAADEQAKAQQVARQQVPREKQTQVVLKSTATARPEVPVSV